MRLVLFFDLPVETPKRRKDYRLFRGFLLKDGLSAFAAIGVCEVGCERWQWRVARLPVFAQTSTAGGIGADPQGYGNSVFDYGVHKRGKRPDYEEIDSMEELLVL